VVHNMTLAVIAEMYGPHFYIMKMGHEGSMKAQTCKHGSISKR